MLGTRGGTWLALAWGAFLGAFTFLAITDFALVTNATWCGNADMHCLREWVGALSGWAAAVAAGITILALYDQLREQRKQTDFVLGEALPTFDAYSEGFVDVYLRVVNWNRRTFLIDKIVCDDAKAISVYKVKLEHRAEAEALASDSAVFYPPIRVAAFDDRSKAPAICRLEIQVFGDDTSPPVMNFAIYGRLLGEKHSKLVLTATAQVKTVRG